MSPRLPRDDQIAFAKKARPSATSAPPRPMTGEEFLESLRDGREVYIYGERVKDVTTHPAFRNTARMVARLYDALHDPKHKDKLLVPTDTGNGGMTHAYFKCPEDRRGVGRRPRRDRRMGAALLRLARPRARLQGGVPRHARRQRRFLRALAGERQALVPVQPGARAVRQPRHHPPAGRPQPAAARGRRRLLPRREGDRRRHRRLRRQGGGDRLGADQLHLHRAPRPDPRRRQEVRGDLHDPDRRAGREADLPPVLRDDLDARWAARSTIRCPAASTRTTPSSSSTRCWCPGRTCSATATSRRPTTSSRAPASCRARCCTAARGSRSSSISSPACC